MVSVRSDWRTSVFANDSLLIGVVRRNSRSVRVARTAGSSLRTDGQTNDARWNSNELRYHGVSMYCVPMGTSRQVGGLGELTKFVPRFT